MLSASWNLPFVDRRGTGNSFYMQQRRIKHHLSLFTFHFSLFSSLTQHSSLFVPLCLLPLAGFSLPLTHPVCRYIFFAKYAYIDRRFFMLKIQQEYLIDEKGKKKAVVVSCSAWKKIKEELEELADIRAYDKAKTMPSNPVPFDEAVKKIRKRKLN
jgi:hypothetical protein